MDTRTLPAALGQVAEWYPNRTAFVQAGGDLSRRYTYAEVYATAAQFANSLHSAGVSPGERVAFLSQTTVEHAVAYLGTQLAGAIPATLHVREAPATIGAMLDHVAPKVLVFQPEFGELVDDTKETTESDIELSVYFDHRESIQVPDFGVPYSRFVADASTNPPAVDVAPDDVAFINFSSGTTGMPKSIVHTQEEAIEGAHLGQYKLRIRSGGTYLIQATPSFIGWSMLLFPTVNTGSTGVFLERWSPEAVLEAMETYELDLLLLVSTQWRHVLAENPAKYDTSSVTHAIYTGEPINTDLLSQIQEQICEDVYTVYSSTEALNAGTVLFPEEVTESTLGSVGKPVPNVDLRLVDPETSNPEAVVDCGEVGEVLLRGPPVAESIWNPTPETSGLFHEDGWWISGDLGRVGPDGNLHLVGRTDNMIVSGGINIYAEGVERELERHPEIREALIVGVPDKQWGETVKAYVVTEADLTAEALEEWCQESYRLADYQRPRYYEFVTSLPRTASGKLDRNAVDE